jgi:endonuclease YncB( thermonuclease family)
MNSSALSFLILLTAQPLPPHAQVLDGDSIRVGETIIRIENIDAPEIRLAHCAAEREKGLLAKRALQWVISNRPALFVRSRDRDAYGRRLGRIITPMGDAGQLMISLGYALPWKDGRKAKLNRMTHWCSGTPKQP